MTASKVWSDSHGALWQGDVRACLAAMEPASVQVVCCSPPYHGLRAYGTAPQLWGGDPACSHSLADAPNLPPMTGGSGAASTKQVSNAGSQFGNAWAAHVQPGKPFFARNFDGVGHSASPEALERAAIGRSRPDVASATCTLCGCWYGELGSEPTVEQYIANLVEVFAAVRRVLRADGVLWVNLGSSYAGSHGNGYQQTMDRQNRTTGQVGNVDLRRLNGRTDGGYKAKDLIQTPSLLFEALQRDGWRLRSVAPWIKRNGMPESCTDRPTHSLEWIGLFSKSARYFWDAEAGRLAPTSQPQRRFAALRYGTGPYRQNGMGGLRDEPAPDAPDAARNRRNTDWYFGGLDAEIEAVAEELAALRDLRANGGVRLGDDGLPLAFDVNPAGFEGAHFATWPPALVRPMVALATSERGACATCGAPWKRQTSARYENPGNRTTNGQKYIGRGHETADYAVRLEKRVDTLGWAPTCPHPDADVVPCKVLDIFNGSGTSMVVARQLGRYGIGIELSSTYCDMAINRLRQHVLF